MRNTFAVLPDLTPEQITRFYTWVRIDPNGCWIWQGKAFIDGYGVTSIASRAPNLTHRMAYKIAYHQDPLEQIVCHSCDVRACCNPLHLFLGSRSDNAQDALRKGRFMSLKGADNPSAKLTIADVLQIRQLSVDGVAQTDIAKRFNINQPHVSRIVKRQAWKHI